MSKYQWCSPDAKNNKEFLGFIYERLHSVFGERIHMEYMQRLEKLINQADGVIPTKLNKILEHNLVLKAQREAFIDNLHKLPFNDNDDIHLAIQAFDKANNLMD